MWYNSKSGRLLKLKLLPNWCGYIRMGYTYIYQAFCLCWQNWCVAAIFIEEEKIVLFLNPVLENCYTRRLPIQKKKKSICLHTAALTSLLKPCSLQNQSQQFCFLSIKRTYLFISYFSLKIFGRISQSFAWLVGPLWMFFSPFMPVARTIWPLEWVGGPFRSSRPATPPLFAASPPRHLGSAGALLLLLRVKPQIPFCFVLSQTSHFFLSH